MQALGTIKKGRNTALPREFTSKIANYAIKEKARDKDLKDNEHSQAHPERPKNTLIFNNYQSTVVQFQKMKPSNLSRINTIRKNFKMPPQHLSKCIREEHGLSGHLDMKSIMKKEKPSGIITMYERTSL